MSPIIFIANFAIIGTDRAKIWSLLIFSNTDKVSLQKTLSLLSSNSVQFLERFSGNMSLTTHQHNKLGRKRVTGKKNLSLSTGNIYFINAFSIICQLLIFSAQHLPDHFM